MRREQYPYDRHCPECNEETPTTSTGAASTVGPRTAMTSVHGQTNKTTNTSMTDERCPLCGDTVAKYHSYIAIDEDVTFRSDAKVCSRKKDDMSGHEVWVHLPN